MALVVFSDSTLVTEFSLPSEEDGGLQSRPSDGPRTGGTGVPPVQDRDIAPRASLPAEERGARPPSHHGGLETAPSDHQSAFSAQRSIAVDNLVDLQELWPWLRLQPRPLRQAKKAIHHRQG